MPNMRQYKQWLKEWKADPRLQDPHAAEREWTVDDLATTYLDRANRMYVKRGKITSRVYTVRLAMETFNNLYRRMPLSEIEPSHLAKYRDGVITREDGTARCRTTVNEWVSLIKNAFKWAAENGHVDPNVALNLTVVSNLQKNRTEAVESSPREAIHPDIVEKTIAHAYPQLADMIRLL